MIGLQYEMTYEETIEGPLGSTSGWPVGERMCWIARAARLHGPRIEAPMTATWSCFATTWAATATRGCARTCSSGVDG
jgi:hypothetical protein